MTLINCLRNQNWKNRITLIMKSLLGRFLPNDSVHLFQKIYENMRYFKTRISFQLYLYINTKNNYHNIYKMKDQIENELATPQLRKERASQNRKVKSLQSKRNLHDEFQFLKQKIKDIQHKNTSTLEQIHQTYNFRKKTFHSHDPKDFQKKLKKKSRKEGNYFPGQSSILTFGNKDHELKLQKKTRDLHQKLDYQSVNRKSIQASIEKKIIQEFQENDQKHLQLRNLDCKQMKQKRIHDLNEKSLRYEEKVLNQTLISIQEGRFQKLQSQFQSVQFDLFQKERQVIKLQKNQAQLKNYFAELQDFLDRKLEHLYFYTTNQCFSLIEKAVRTNQIKVKNLRKISLKLRDSVEDRKSNKLIQMGKTRRNSGSKNKSKSINKREKTNHSQKNVQQKNKQFQEIANRYERLIKQKVEELERLSQKYRDKDRQCYELKMKVDVLQKKLSQNKKNIINESNFPRKNQQLQQKYPHQLQLFEKQQQLTKKENILSEKDEEVRGLQQKITNLSQSLKDLKDQYKITIQKNIRKNQEQLKQKTNISEKIINEKTLQINEFKFRLGEFQKKILSKDYQIENIKNKLRKNELYLENRDKKIQQLQKLLTISEDSKSNLEENLSVVDSLKDEKKWYDKIDNLENQLEKKKSEIFRYIKQKDIFLKKIQQLQKNQRDQKISEKQNLKEAHEKLKSENQHLKDENEQLRTSIHTLETELEKNMKISQNDILDMDDEINFKHQHRVIPEQDEENESSYQENFLSDDGAIDSETSVQHIESREYIIMERNSEMNQVKKSLTQLEEKHHKLLSQFEICTEQNKILKIQLEKKYDQIEFNQKKLSELQNQLLDITQQRKSVSTASETENQKIKCQKIEGENNELKTKIRQLESQVQIQKQMETKVLNQYKTNLSITRIKLQEEQEENEQLAAEVQALQSTINSLNIQLEQLKISDQSVLENLRSNQNCQLKEKIQFLEYELLSAKDIIQKLQEVQTQLFKQVKIYEEQKSQLIKELQRRANKIEQLEQQLELKISPRTNKRTLPKKPSLLSQNSLKYSSNSQLLLSSSFFHPNRHFEENIGEIEVSEAGSEIYDQSSQISHLQQFLTMEEQTYQKQKNLRVHYNSLLKKTTSYIKSLKNVIHEKNKRIQILEKKNQMLKGSELVRNQLKTERIFQEEEKEEGWIQGVFKDYESVELGKKKNHHKKIRIMEDDTNLVIQENMILSEKVQKLEQEIVKAQEQEQSLCKIKDLYKEEIKNLISEIENQKKEYEGLVQQQKKKLEESESAHNIEAMKQLFYKIVQVYSVKFVEDHVGEKKKEQKRKQLEQYVKIMSNILKCDTRMKDKLLSMLKK